MTGPSGPPRLSIAIPLLDEEQVLPELLRRLRAVLAELPGGPHEMVFVDDGSTDRTFEILRAEAEKDTRIVAVSLSRNFGHQAALSAALDCVSGDLVVLMDGDLQDEPEQIPLLLEEQRRGFDVVYARRVQRKESWYLRFSYYVFYRLLALLSDVRLPLDAGDFAVLSRRVVDRLRSMGEHHRYLRGLRSWVGFRQTGIALPRAERRAGLPKYGLGKLVRLALDAVFAFSVIPLRAASYFGLFTIAASVLYAAHSVYKKLFLGLNPPGFTGLIVTIAFLGGAQLLFLGVIGEYLGRIYEEVKNRPHYVVAQTVNVRGALPR